MLIDTAGRLHIDDELMGELERIRAAVQPHQIDAGRRRDDRPGRGQRRAAASTTACRSSGVVMTKLDGDARGGAALSVRAVTGAPILFAGTGEKLDALEVFHPDRMATRILGMGDVLTLIERAEQAYDEKQALALQRKLRRNEFTLEDFRDQLRAVRKMGAVGDLLDMIPGMKKLTKGMDMSLGRDRAEAHRGDHQLDDARGARQRRDHQRQPAPSHRRRQRRDGRRREPVSQAVPADQEDDETRGALRRQRHAAGIGLM